MEELFTAIIVRVVRKFWIQVLTCSWAGALPSDPQYVVEVFDLRRIFSRVKFCLNVLLASKVIN